MKKYIIVVGVLGVIGLAGAMVARRNADVEKTNQQIAAEVNGNSLETALASEKDFFCTFRERKANNSGVIFVSGNRFRADYQTEDQGEKSTSHMALKDGWFYVWSSTSQPFKMNSSLVEKMKGPQSIQETIKGAVIPESRADVKCLPWEMDEKMIGLPEGLEFVDLSEDMMRIATTPGASESAKQLETKP